MLWEQSESTEPTINPTKAALRGETPPGEPLQGHQSCWPSPAALPVPSLQPGQCRQGDTLCSHHCSSGALRMQSPFPRRTMEPGKLSPSSDNIGGAGWGHSRRRERGRAQPGWPRAPKSRGQQNALGRCECAGTAATTPCEPRALSPGPTPSSPARFPKSAAAQAARGDKQGSMSLLCEEPTRPGSRFSIPGIHRAESNSSPVPPLKSWVSPTKPSSRTEL